MSIFQSNFSPHSHLPKLSGHRGGWWLPRAGSPGQSQGGWRQGLAASAHPTAPARSRAAGGHRATGRVGGALEGWAGTVRAGHDSHCVWNQTGCSVASPMSLPRRTVHDDGTGAFHESCSLFNKETLVRLPNLNAKSERGTFMLKSFISYDFLKKRLTSFHYMHLMLCSCLAFLIFIAAVLPQWYRWTKMILAFARLAGLLHKSFPSASPSGGAFLSLLTAPNWVIYLTPWQCYSFCRTCGLFSVEGLNNRFS